ncbi:MAG: PorV/PorQ family protein [Elusimicrobiota bacterium]
MSASKNGRALKTKRAARTSSLCAAVVLLALGASRSSAAVSGTEGASFLDIPVGGRPAALGGAYSALAEDAYAPVYNAGGLAFLSATELSGMHLDYAGSGGYEFVSAVHPLGARDGLGVAAQYFHADITNALDANGNPIGNVSTHYGAYSLAYGHAFTEEFSLGAAVKLIDAQIADVSARDAAADVGALYRVNSRLSLAAGAVNLGGRLQFLQQADTLPENFHGGLLYKPLTALSLVAEAAYDRTGLVSGRFGAEWRPVSFIALRGGYRTETTQQLSALAGMTTGFGLEVLGMRLDYAWVPLGDLGQTQYFSIVFAFGKKHGA